MIGGVSWLLVIALLLGVWLGVGIGTGHAATTLGVAGFFIVLAIVLAGLERVAPWLFGRGD